MSNSGWGSSCTMAVGPCRMTRGAATGCRGRPLSGSATCKNQVRTRVHTARSTARQRCTGHQYKDAQGRAELSASKHMLQWLSLLRRESQHGCMASKCMATGAAPLRTAWEPRLVLQV